jgi:hypothetical protein
VIPFLILACMLYAIAEEYDQSVVKIGYTRTADNAVDEASIYARLSCLQCSHWKPLMCLALSPGSERDEQALFADLDHYCVRGEWFLNIGEVAAWVGAWSHPLKRLRNKPYRRLRNVSAEEHSRDPTPRQHDILSFMRDYEARNGRPPSYRRIADGVRMTASGVTAHFKVMKRLGLLYRPASSNSRASWSAMASAGLERGT